MGSLADWRDAEHVWRRYRETGDLQMLREELLTSPVIINVPGEQDVFFLWALKDRDIAAAELLLELGLVDVGRPAPDGYHDLHWVIEESDEDDPTMARFLLDHGADLEQRGVNDWAPLHMAAIRGRLKIAEFLLDRGADINARTRIDGCLTPLMEAAWVGNLEMVQMLLNRGANPRLKTVCGETAADRAASNGKEDVAAFLSKYVP